MGILALIDRLDDLVHRSKAVPLTDQVRLDKGEVYDIVDQMRGAIPEEIKQARWFLQERESRPDDPADPASATVISVGEAEADLSGLLHRAKFGGESFVVELAGVPMARIVSA